MVQVDSGGDLRIIGDENSDAVFCTLNKTYSIKKVETSNAVCLVPPIPQGDGPVFFIEAIKQYYYEVDALESCLDKCLADECCS
jgi:hypothetical protein